MNTNAAAAVNWFKPNQRALGFQPGGACEGLMFGLRIQRAAVEALAQARWNWSAGRR